MNKIETEHAPASIGPFSQAIVDDGRIYVSGQGPVDPETGEIVSTDIRQQTHQTLDNVEAILDAAGSSLENTLKATVFVTDMDDYDAINEIYQEYFTDPYPARSAVQVVELPIDIGVEIEVVATE